MFQLVGRGQSTESRNEERVEIILEIDNDSSAIIRLPSTKINKK